MKKKILCLAVAATLGSSAANAVDLNVTPNVSNTYATENTIPAAGLTLAPVAANTVTVNTGFSISDGTERYMRFDLTNATFTDATNLALAVSDSSGAGNAKEVLSTGGAAKGSFVVYEVTASTGNTVAVSNDAVLTLPNLTVTGTGSIGVTYRLYSSPVDAVNNTTTSALVTTSGTIATFAAANSTSNTASANTITPLKIDVTQNAAKFATNTSNLTSTVNIVGDITVADTAGNQMRPDGTTDVTTALIQSASVLTVTGDFTFTKNTDGTYTAAKVFIDNVTPFDCKTSNIAATSLNATTAVLPTAQVVGQMAICATANGTDAISEQTFTAVYAPTENAGYTDPDTTLTLNTWGKNGSSTSLNLGLSPTGAFKNWVRINNTSSIAGKVFITVYNDAGKSVAVPLGNITGQPATVGAQASTGLIAVGDIVAAATAKDATFAVGAAPSNKLRFVIDGEFSSIAAQSITTAIDNNTFTTF